MTRFIRRMALFLLLPTLPAMAQEETRAGVTAYAAAWFAANQPGTARDMLALLPGFRLQEGDSSLRGFSGTVGNVLIDGVLPAGKEDDVGDLLQRIPAGAVARIELIRPNAGLDMHGYPLMANVVRLSTASVRGRVELEEAFNHYGMSAPRGSVTLARQGDGDVLDLSASYGREWNGNHGFGRRDRFAANGTVLKLAEYAQPEFQIAAEMSARYRSPFWGGRLELGGVITQEVEYSDVSERVSFPAASLSSERERERERGLEAQLHYEHPLADGGLWEIFFQHRTQNQYGLSSSTDAGGTDTSQSRSGMRESVLRGNARRNFGAWSLEGGGEGAINVLNSSNALVVNSAVVPLPADTIRVEEQRAEFFANATWRAAPELTLELGLRQEISRIHQDSDTVSSRDLSFFKPRILASWRPLEGTELRLLAERRVGQLDFDGFASSASLNNNTVSAGNRNLMPERATRLELAWEQHFWDRASLTLTLRREFVTGVLDHLVIVTPTDIFDATGNIGNGRRDEAELALLLPLDRAGLTGVTLQFDGTLRETGVTDPVTGQRRRFSGDEPLEGRIALTHDLPQWNLRWGFSYSAPTQETEYRFDEIDRRHHVSHLNAFIEYRPLPAWTARLFAQDLAQSAFVRERLLYDGLRNVVPLDTRELRRLNNGALFGLNLRYDFNL